MSVPPSRMVQASQLIALLVTNAIKLGGLYVAIHTAATEANPNVVLIGAAAFMMAGAQVTEEQILKLIGRMFGGGAPKPPGE